MFKSPYTQIDEQGISTLKNRRVITHIKYRDIESSTIYKGHLLKKWFVTLSLSVSLANIAFISLAYAIIHYTDNIQTFNLIKDYHLLSILIPSILLLAGTILIYFSLKHCAVMSVETSTEKYRIRLKEFEKENKLSDLIDFLQSKVNLTVTSDIYEKLQNHHL